jgi:hypothetical protein
MSGGFNTFLQLLPLSEPQATFKGASVLRLFGWVSTDTFFDSSALF